MKILSSILLATLIVALLGSLSAIHAQGQTPTVFGPETYTRDTGNPQIITRMFSVEDSTGEFTLLIQNGIAEGSQASSAVVELNGVRVAGPADFNQQVFTIDKPVRLEQHNIITVEVRGAPDSSIVVSILRGPASSIFPKLTLFTNRNDPELLRSEAPNGDVIDYFGTKDDDGLATALKVIRVQSANGDVTTIFLDERARPILIDTPNGLSFLIRWQTDTLIVVTVTTEDALFAVDVPFDLTTGTAGQAVFSSTLTKVEALWGVKADIHKLLVNTRMAAHGATLARTASTTSLVTVRQCGAPVNNATVSFVVTAANRSPVTGYGNLLGQGVYSLSIPTFDNTARLRQEQKCKSVARYIGFACNIFNHLIPLTFERPLCVALTVALAANPFTAEFAAFVPGSCLAILYAVRLACTVGFNGPVVTPLNESDPYIAGKICEWLRKFGEAKDRALTAPFDLSVSVRIPSVAGTVSQYYSGVSPFGPFPPLTFDFPCQRQQCVPGLGGQYFSDGREVKVTILPFEADFTDEIRLLSPINHVIGTNQDVGRVVNLGSFRSGTELIFGIYVRNTGQTFKMGPALRNPDRIAHARVECLGDGKAKVLFEDNLGGGDRDFDDAVFQITAGP